MNMPNLVLGANKLSTLLLSNGSKGLERKSWTPSFEWTGSDPSTKATGDGCIAFYHPFMSFFRSYVSVQYHTSSTFESVQDLPPSMIVRGVYLDNRF